MCFFLGGGTLGGIYLLKCESNCITHTRKRTQQWLRKSYKKKQLLEHTLEIEGKLIHVIYRMGISKGVKLMDNLTKQSKKITYPEKDMLKVYGCFQK